MSNPDETIIKVSKNSSSKAVASVIAKAAENGHYPKIRAIGAGAVSQASKACAIASQYAAVNTMYLSFIIGFDDVEGDDGTISAVTWKAVPLH